MDSHVEMIRAWERYQDAVSMGRFDDIPNKEYRFRQARDRHLAEGGDEREIP